MTATDITARQEAEARLQESETHLRAAAELTGLSLYRWAPATGALQWDARVKAMWGLPANAHVDHDVWLKGIHPDDRERVAAAAKRSIDPDGDGTYAVEYRVVGLSDGVERWVSARAQTFFEGRAPVRQLGAVQEITQQKHTEERLRRSEAYLSAILQQLPLGVGVFDRNGRLTLDNPVSRQYVTGELPSHTAEQRNRWRVFREDGSIARPEDYPGARALRGETTVPGTDTQYIPPNDEPVWIRVSAAPLRDESGEITGAIATYQDVDQEKRVAASLRESEARFRRFAEHATNVLWILNVEQDAIEYRSPAYEQVWGRPCDEGLGVPGRWKEALHPDDQEGASSALARILEGESALTHEFHIVRPDGSVRLIRDTWFPMPDDDGRLRRIAGITEDITPETEAQVYVVGRGDASFKRRTLLLRDAGYRIHAFVTTQAFLEIASVLAAGCVVLDVQEIETPDTAAFLRTVSARRASLPVVIVCNGRGNARQAVQFIKAGAVDYLAVPNDDAEPLLTAVASALADVRNIADRDKAAALTREQIAQMQPREREVLQGLLSGATNKEIARALSISPRTVEIHRANAMVRIGARTLPEAVLLATAAGLRRSWPPVHSS